jgi:predicted dehydrogenase
MTDPRDATAASDGPAAAGRRAVHPAKVGLIGSGWRAEFYARMARLMPDRWRISGVVTRSAARGERVHAAWRVPSVRTVTDLIAMELPDYVVVAVPWDVTPGFVAELADAGIPVLTETPPAPDLRGLRDLWSRVGASGLVQVAEHSPLMPSHAARLAVLSAGAIGQVTQVQISSTHMYHAVAVIRRMLGAGMEPVDIVARRFTAPLVDPQTKNGWTDNAMPQQAGTTLGLLDFGAGRSAVYDFTDNQWHNPLRVNRILVRGSHGEILDDRVTRWVDERTVVASPLARRQIGIEQDLEGFDLDFIAFEGRPVYRNAYVGARLADDDIAVAALMDAMAAWTRGVGPEPYPLAQGCQDHMVALAMDDAIRAGAPVRTELEPWAGGNPLVGGGEAS